jgi:hypothetical protein
MNQARMKQAMKISRVHYVVYNIRLVVCNGVYARQALVLPQWVPGIERLGFIASHFTPHI